MKKQRGIGLLELMLSLAIIAILIVMVTRYYLTARTAQQVKDAGDIVVALYSAGQSWIQSNDNFSGDMIKIFVNNGTVPRDFGPKSNPWGGDIVATGSGTPTLEIKLTNVPQAACQNLKARVMEKIVNSTPSCGTEDTTTFTLDLDMSK